jgi:hypothetical protein
MTFIVALSWLAGILYVALLVAWCALPPALPGFRIPEKWRRRHYKPLSDHSDREREKLLARLNQMDRERKR